MLGPAPSSWGWGDAGLSRTAGSRLCARRQPIRGEGCPTLPSGCALCGLCRDLGRWFLAPGRANPGPAPSLPPQRGTFPSRWVTGPEHPLPAAQAPLEGPVVAPVPRQNEISRLPTTGMVRDPQRPSEWGRGRGVEGSGGAGLIPSHPRCSSEQPGAWRCLGSEFAAHTAQEQPALRVSPAEPLLLGLSWILVWGGSASFLLVLGPHLVMFRA